MKINVEYIDTREEEQILSTQEQEALLRAQNSLKKLPYLAIKRLTDIIFAIIGLVLMIPLTIVVKLGYLFTGDTAKIFYTQKRIGKNGKEFNFYKFRSMIARKNGKTAEEILMEMLDNDPAKREEYEKFHKLKDDPRITKWGKFLRRTSLDEFPQFLNVLKGDMSIIGNRPYLVREKADMGEYFDDIVSTKGGLVSYWAVSGRSGVDFKERLKLEQQYSKEFGFKTDCKIFFTAFKAVFGGKGAN